MKTRAPMRRAPAKVTTAASFAALIGRPPGSGTGRVRRGHAQHASDAPTQPNPDQTRTTEGQSSPRTPQPAHHSRLIADESSGEGAEPDRDLLAPDMVR